MTRSRVDDGASQPSDIRARLVAAVHAHGREAVSFQALEDGLAVYEDPDGLVAYADTGTAHVAVGSPLAPEDAVAEVGARFVAHAKARRRRALFVGVENPSLFRNVEALVIGEQPVYEPATWADTLRRKRSLREQLRRARAKGVRVRRVEASEIAEGSPLRAHVEALAADWLRTRHMEPMRFLVALEPFHEPTAHRYFLAEHEGSVVAFASAVPIPAAGGYLLEDVVRAREMPNGTSELLVDALFRELRDAPMVTLGLAPLTGAVHPVLKVIRAVTRPLYDFAGVRAYKERLAPGRFDRVYLVHPEHEWTMIHVIETLRAFAGGSLVVFGTRSLLGHPSGPPFLLVMPLVAWILSRLGLALAGRAGLFGTSTGALLAWCVADAVIALVLFRAALRPSRTKLLAATAAALGVAVASGLHVASVGFGGDAGTRVIRGIVALAPVVGAGLLGLASRRQGLLDDVHASARKESIHP